MKGFGFAILGTGMISKDMRTALMRADNTVTLAAVGSRALDTAKEFAKLYHKAGFDKPQAFGSYKEAIECPAAKAVYVAVPTALEEEVVMQCIAAGKHVLADKPFLSAASVARMTKAAADKGLLFMDATHFAHCARTALIREKLAKGVIGEVQFMTVNFFAGSGLLADNNNIRFDPKLEPMGAVGDLGWYTARAAIEYLVPDPAVTIKSVASINVQPSPTGTIARGTSIVQFSNGTVLTSAVGFCGSWDQTLSVHGTGGRLVVSDFLLDHHNSGVFTQPWRPLKVRHSSAWAVLFGSDQFLEQFEIFVGANVEPTSVYNVPSHGMQSGEHKEPRALMFEDFARDASNAAQHAFWAQQTHRTQTIVDAMFKGSL